MKNSIILKRLIFVSVICLFIFSCKDSLVEPEIIGTSSELESYAKHIANININSNDVKSNGFIPTSDGGYISYYYNDEHYYAVFYTEIAIQKYDSEGKLEWEYKYNYQQKGLLVGEFILTDDGSIAFVVSIEKAIYGLDTNSATFAMDMVLVKISAEGNFLWEKTYDIERWDKAYTLNNTADEGFIIGGSVEFDTGNVNSTSDGIIIKTNANGEIEWTKTYGVEGREERIKQVIQTKELGFIATMEVLPTYLEGEPLTNIMMLNQSGEFVKNIDHPFGYFWSDDILEANDGGYILGLVNNLPGLGLIKIMNNGDVSWDKQYVLTDGAPLNTYNFGGWPKGLYMGSLINSGYFVIVRNDTEDSVPTLGMYSVYKFDNSGNKIE